MNIFNDSTEDEGQCIDRQYEKDLLKGITSANRRAEEAEKELAKIQNLIQEQAQELRSQEFKLRQQSEIIDNQSMIVKQQAETIDTQSTEIIELNNRIEELSDELNTLKMSGDERRALENEVSELRKTETQLSDKVGDLILALGEQEKNVERLERECQKLRDEAEGAKENATGERLRRDVQQFTIEEEKDDFEPPNTPPSRAFPRQSIGQWSVERMRNNMSVRSMVSSMERKRP